MSRLWVPPSVTREVGENTREFNARVDLAVWRDSAYADHWNPILKGYDPYLELVKAPESVDEPGMIPGFWHIQRVVPGAPTTFIPLRGAKGEYVEPTAQILDILNAGDLQNERVMRERREFDERAARQRQRDADLETEQRRDDMVANYKAITRPHVSFSDAKPWTNRAGARRQS